MNNENEFEDIEEDGNSSLYEEGDFKFWLEYFDNKNYNENSLKFFKENIQLKDVYFLNHPLELDFNNELYSKIRPGGFLEEDFQNLIVNYTEEEKSKKSYKEIEERNNFFKTRIAIAIFYDLGFELIKNRIGLKNFNSVIEKSIIEGFYENIDIPFEKLIGKAYKNSLIKKEDIIDFSFLRGVELGKRYPDN